MDQRDQIKVKVDKKQVARDNDRVHEVIRNYIDEHMPGPTPTPPPETI